MSSNYNKLRSTKFPDLNYPEYNAIVCIYLKSNYLDELKVKLEDGLYSLLVPDLHHNWTRSVPTIKSLMPGGAQGSKPKKGTAMHTFAELAFEVVRRYMADHTDREWTDIDKDEHINVMIMMFVAVMYEVEFDQPRKFSMHLLDASLKKLDAHHKLFKKPGESGPAYEIRNLKRDLQKSEIDRKKAQTQYEQLKTDLDSREDNSDHLRKELAAAKTELRRQAEDKDKEIDDLNSTIEDLDSSVMRLCGRPTLLKSGSAKSSRSPRTRSGWPVRGWRMRLCTWDREWKASGPSGSTGGNYEFGSHQRAGIWLFWIHASGKSR
jgi:hypothetical protein